MPGPAASIIAEIECENEGQAINNGVLEGIQLFSQGLLLWNATKPRWRQKAQTVHQSSFPPSSCHPYVQIGGCVQTFWKGPFLLGKEKESRIAYSITNGLQLFKIMLLKKGERVLVKVFSIFWDYCILIKFKLK